MRSSSSVQKTGTNVSRRLLSQSLVWAALLAASLLSAFRAPDFPYPDDAATPSVTGTQARPERSENDSLLPVDPQVIRGRLANGVRYVVRENGRPQNRAELRLVIDAGSILEDDDQLGLAHFVEHMAFNGTENFEKQSLIDYLETVGTRFGADLNAYTGFDETVYMLEVRTDSTDQLRTGLEVLREWATRIAFDPEEVELERNVVIEEWRQDRGASARVRDVQLPVLLSGSHYAERLPIGNTAVIETFEHDALRRFYDTWYRPDLMSVVAVGDFDASAIVQKIESLFSEIAEPAAPRARGSFDMPWRSEPLVSIASDPELPYGSVELVFKRKAEDPNTLEAFRRSVTATLYSRMFNSRLDELTQDIDPPFTLASSGLQGLVRGADAYSLSAIVRDGLYGRAAEVLLTETERVRRFGFLSSELERQKVEVLRAFERALAERDNTESGRYASRYVAHLLDDEPIPGIEFQHSFVERVLPEISIGEVNALTESFLTRDNRVILVSGPQSDENRFPVEKALLALFDEVAALSLEPYVDEMSEDPLVPSIPAPAAVVDRYDVEEIGLTIVEFENGVRLWLKPTDFKSDEVILAAYSPGGTSLVADSAYVSASFAAGLIRQGGVGSLGPIELEKKLTGSVVSVGPSISGLSEGLSGSASPKDLETLFQLTYLYVTAPRVDSVAFESYKTRLGSLLLTSQASPRSAFADTIAVTMASYHPRARPLSQETLEVLDLQEAYAVYRDRFADSGDFTYYMVGAFDLDEAVQHASRYLGTLPATGRRETWRDVGIRPPEGFVEKTVRRGIEPQSSIRLFYTGDAEWSMDERRLISLLADAFQIKLREVLREKLGGTYGVGVSGSLSRDPRGSFRISIGFDCDPERVDELMHIVETQVDSLIEVGLPETYLVKVREATLRSHETNLRVNRYWLSTLALFDQYELDPRTIETGIREYVSRITAEDLHGAATRYFGTRNVARFVLKPETDSTDSAN